MQVLWSGLLARWTFSGGPNCKPMHVYEMVDVSKSVSVYTGICLQIFHFHFVETNLILINLGLFTCGCSSYIIQVQIGMKFNNYRSAQKKEGICSWTKAEGIWMSRNDICPILLRLSKRSVRITCAASVSHTSVLLYIDCKELIPGKIQVFITPLHLLSFRLLLVSYS